jgi:NMT1-like family
MMALRIRWHRAAEIWRKLSKPLVIVLATATIAVAGLYIIYRLVDPLPPHHFTIAAGAAGSGYDNFARQYARILARHGVTLEVRNSAGAVENLDLLRGGATGVQAALAAFGVTQPRDADTLYSLGGIYDAEIFILYRNAEPIAQFSQLRGKRLSIGMPGTALRSLILEALKATGALEAATQLLDLDSTDAVDALIAGKIDVAMFPSQLDGSLLQRALGAPGVRLMNVAQAEAIAKSVPGLKHVVLWRGLISLSRDIPSSDIDLLASSNKVLVRKDLHPALQYLLLEAMREVHSGPGPFNRLGEFPAEQPNDLPLSPTAEAFYRSGPTFWQRYTSYWLTSLLNRFVFFVIPVVVMLIPLIGFFGPRFYRWLHVHRIDQLHRTLGNLERDLEHSADTSRIVEYQARFAEIESDTRSLKVGRAFVVDLQLLRFHLRMVQEHVGRMAAANR